MSIGETILGLLGNKDPRLALMQAAMGANSPQPAAPYAGGAAGAAPTDGGPAAGGAGVQPSPQPEAYKSPEDLSSMYENLLKYKSRADSINRGVGLIGASLSQEENRAATLAAFTGDTSGLNIDPGTIAELATTMQKNKAAAASRAAALAGLPAIAKKYGLDLDTAKYLYDSGELDAVIKEREKPNTDLVTDGNGVVRLIDKTTGTERATFGAPKNTNTGTDDTKEYEYYKADEAAAGRTPMSFSEWQTKLKQSGAPQTNVNIPPGEKKFEEKVGEQQGERYANIQKSADGAMQELDNYNMLEQALSTGVRTGWAGESELALRKAAVAMGLIDPDSKIAGGEMVQMISNKMALQMRNPESGMGMPGSLSDKDLQFLKNSQIGLSTSPEGNKAALEVFRRMARRKIEIADLAEEWVTQHKSMVGFNRKLKQYSEQNPLFGDLDPNIFKAPAANEAGGGAGKSVDDLVKFYNSGN